MPQILTGRQVYPPNAVRARRLSETKVPAVQVGWMSRHGYRKEQTDTESVMICPESGWRYEEKNPGLLRCLDWPEEEPLPDPNA